MRSAAITLLFALSIMGCRGGALGDEPTSRCVPEGACDETIFRAGLRAEQGDPTRGAITYTRDCVQCHGPEGVGLASASRIDMTSSAWQRSMRDSTIVKAIRMGRPPMPSYTFTDDEFRDLLAHIRSFEKAPVIPTRSPKTDEEGTR